MRAVLPVVLLLLAGCATDSPAPETSAEPTSDPETAGPSPEVGDAGPDSSVPVNATGSSFSFHFAVAFANPVPSIPPFGQEFEVGTFTIGQDARDVTAFFDRHHISVELFAANCRLYSGAILLDQDAFSDAQVGNFDSKGTCELTFDELPQGAYRLVYLYDGTDPSGIHDVAVDVTGKH